MSDTASASPKRWFFYLPEHLLFSVALIHIVVCPFTKVEESFNLQACHDLLYHGWDLNEYDHHEFPGVVPRTFIGPIVVSAVSFPFVKISEWVGASKFVSQFIVRSALSMLVLLGFKKFSASVKSKLGFETYNWHLIITMSQFHFMFYAGRPLPNIFALALTLYALHHWLQGNSFRFILTSAAAIIIFRGELAIFLGIFLLMDLVVGRMKFWRTVIYGIVSLVICLSLTVAVDSYFWRRTLWPEGEVLYYNIILNKSSNWGTSPWGWYFYSALPRALFASLPFVPLGLILDRPGNRTLIFLLPCLLFITLYSFLPHKELRFIIYVIPVLNVVAAEACKKIWIGRHKSFLRKCVALVAALHVVANFCVTGLMLNISRQNYPGGQAIMALHEMEFPDSAIRLHIDVYTAQTGVSRFTQLYDNWVYDKSENLSPKDFISKRFTHLLVEENPDRALLRKELDENFEVAKEIFSYAGLKVDPKTFPPITLKRKKAISILALK